MGARERSLWSAGVWSRTACEVSRVSGAGRTILRVLAEVVRCPAWDVIAECEEAFRFLSQLAVERIECGADGRGNASRSRGNIAGRFRGGHVCFKLQGLVSGRVP
jgi:hypothetical protein